MSQDPAVPPDEPAPSPGPAAAPPPAAAAPARPRRPRRRPGHRRADRRQPGPVLRRRPADAEHLAGPRAGLRRAGGGRGRRQGAGGAHPQQRRGAARPAAVRHRPAAVPDRAGSARAPTSSRCAVRSRARWPASRRRGPRWRCPKPAATWPNATPAAWKSCTTRIPARSRCAASRSRRPRATRRAARCSRAQADLRKAQEAAGEAGDDNAQLRSAVAAVEKAELDLARTHVVAPARGVVTDLRTDVGHFAQPGAPVMTLIAMHDLWISADLTENNIGHIEPGDEVAIVLDVMPGEVLKGRVRSIGGGVGSGQSTPPGTLPVVQNSRDWLRQAQRIPGGGRVRCRRAAAPEGGAHRRPGRRAGLHRRPPADEPAGRVVHARRSAGSPTCIEQRHDARRQGGTATDDRPGPGRVRRLRPGAAGALCRLHHGRAGAVQAGTAAADGQGAS